ncbi:MAG: cation-translocating P-type ATPase [Chloroflexota bacterium]
MSASSAPRHDLEAWRQDAADVATALGTDVENGLTAAEASTRLGSYGPNELRAKAVRPVWRLFLEQFTNAMILVLIGAAAITAAIGDLKDTVIILAIVILNGVVGFVQEYRAERAMDALKRMTSPSARVVRDGVTAMVAATDLVPGDIVRLDAGDVVTADMRLMEAQSLRINEAALTGESEPAGKSTAPLPDVTAALLADQRNMAFSGTAVTYGRGQAVVVTTGMATALGRVAELLQEHGSGQTPLQRRLSTLGKRLAVAAAVVCVFVFVTGVARGEPVEVMFLTAVSLAVAAIPEGLPAVVTIALALGARRMARRRALIRKLPAVETLGSVTVICSDKTGTLTENRMLVERVWTPSAEYRVTGDGYAPEGTFDPDPGDAPGLDRLARVAAACNDATLRAPTRHGDPWTITGDPTEAALLALAAKRGIDPAELAVACPRIEELTFDSERRRMATLHSLDDHVWVAVKGAPEALAPLLSSADAPALREAERIAETYAAAGYRVLALAERSIPDVPARLDDAEHGLRLVGLVGMADPPRAASEPSIDACRTAGITPIMITGDHPLTATAIARRIGILREGGRSLTGVELETLDETAFDAIVGDVAVYARTNPEQKLRIVDAWTRRGAVVAMTGDGVNDAPALKRADIGVAMGITGTEVSKEAADMVLADDDFATIVAAVEEGRRIYDNIRRFVRYLLTTNSAEIWVMALAPFLGLPFPLIAVQILWINLVTDGFPALALGVEPAERDTMRRPPRPPQESIFARGLWQHAIWVGLWMAAVALVVQAVALDRDWPWQTMVFTTLAILQLGHALAIRSERDSLFRQGLRSNIPLTIAVALTLMVQLALVYVPVLQPIFATEALTAEQLAIVLAASTLGFVAVEMEKWFGRRRDRQAA